VEAPKRAYNGNERNVSAGTQRGWGAVLGRGGQNLPLEIAFWKNSYLMPRVFFIRSEGLIPRKNVIYIAKQ
jgi:hypothetical protein